MEYFEYKRIEKHIDYSKALYTMNKRALTLTKELDKKRRCNKYDVVVEGVYIILQKLCKHHTICSNSYTSLVDLLDEILFCEVQTINNFYIDENKYPLSFIYFNQQEWIDDYDVPYQDFVLDKNSNLSFLEAILVNCFIDDYENTILEVEADIKSTPQQDIRLWRKVLRNLNRLKKRLIIMKAYILRYIHLNVSRRSLESLF